MNGGAPYLLAIFVAPTISVDHPLLHGNNESLESRIHWTTVFCQVLEYEVMKGRIHEDDIVDVAAR